jgi:hypothetical protein
MIKLTPDQWDAISIKIWEEYPPSVSLLRSAMRRELGFTVRKSEPALIQRESSGYYYTARTIFLDFYDDQKELWFTLKYL